MADAVIVTFAKSALKAVQSTQRYVEDPEAKRSVAALNKQYSDANFAKALKAMAELAPHLADLCQDAWMQLVPALLTLVAMIIPQNLSNREGAKRARWMFRILADVSKLETAGDSPEAKKRSKDAAA